MVRNRPTVSHVLEHERREATGEDVDIVGALRKRGAEFAAVAVDGRRQISAIGGVLAILPRATPCGGSGVGQYGE